MSKVFLVTGSSRGLGRSIAEAVLEAGHQIVAAARRPEQLDDLVAQFGGQVCCVPLDVTDFPAAQSAVEAAIAAFGQLDVVVNNAAYAEFASVEDIAIDDFRAQIETNLLGVVNVTKAALPRFREQGSGHFIQISSVGGRSVTPGLSAYQAAKWAIGGFSGVLAREVNPLGIKVTVLEPGGIRTNGPVKLHPVSPPYERSLGALRDILEAGFPAVNDPAKVAQLVLQVVEIDEAPHRLLVGGDAVAMVGAYNSVRAQADAKWIDLSVATNHDNAPAASLDPTSHL